MKKNKLLKSILVFTMAIILIVAQSPVFAKTKKEVVEIKKSEYKITKSKDSKLFVNLEKKITEAKDSDEVPVTVVFNKKLTDDEFASIENMLGNPEIKHKFEVIPGASLSLTKSQISELQKSDLVQQVEFDAKVHATMNTASNWFGISKAREDFAGIDGDRDGAPGTFSKNDIVAAVIDTGIDAGHVDLDGGKVIAWKDWVGNKTTPYDDNGHGTHVSATLAGTGEGNANYKGVAPGAALIGLKVLDANGEGTLSDVTAAIDWAVANKNIYNIRIISLSLGTDESSDGTDSTSVAINNAYNAGIVPVVAAGNSGPQKATIGSPGAAEKALTVGAFADVGEKGFFLGDFSSRGLTADGRMKPDICAPGVYITSAKANSSNQYVTYSGTSMATPFTAGTAALMLDANPNLTPAQVISYITGTAQDWGTPGKDLDYGYGKLDGYNAIKSAGSLTGSAIEVPTHLYKADSLASKGKYDEFTITITDKKYPVSITLLLPNWTSSQDFDLFLYNPSGTQVASSEDTTREEFIGFTPTVTGTYKIKILSYSGNGAYSIDVSSGAASITQSTNQ